MSFITLLTNFALITTLLIESFLCTHYWTAVSYTHLKHGPEGEYLSDGTYSLSDRGRRYNVYLRKQRFYRYLTPVIIAFLTTVATNLLKELWLPALLNWIQGQP